MNLFAVASLALLSFQVPAPAPAPAPKPVEQPKPVQAAKPEVYNEKADAKADIAAALARASANNRRVLLQWGGNWCGWCIKLHDLYRKDRNISRELMYEYDVVYVDIGRWDKNAELAAQYGADWKATGVPYLTVLDATGKVLANQETGVLEDPATAAHDPAKVLEFLKQHQAEYEKADELLAKAQAVALRDKKQVFLTFGAPWCPWCHRLEDWMDTPAAGALLGKDFVIRKIDVDRTIGGKELKAKYCVKEQGIPWFCVLDGQGKLLAKSEFGDEQANIGFPAQDDEIAAFGDMLTTVAHNLTAEDIDALKRSLVEVREASKKKAAQ